jgi:hypothetical protein
MEASTEVWTVVYETHSPEMEVSTLFDSSLVLSQIYCSRRDSW